MDNNIRYLLTAAWLFCAAALYAQKNSFSLGLGVSAIARQDQIFSPFVHTGQSVQQLDLRWQRRAHMVQFAEIRYSGFAVSRFDAYNYTTKPEPETQSTLPHSFTFFELTYGLGKKWSAGPLQIGVGGALENTVNALNYQYGRASFFGYYAAFSLSPWLEMSRNTGKKGHLHLAVSSPLVSWTARSPYLVNDDEFILNSSSHKGARTFLNYVADGHLRFPDQLQQLRASAGYTHQFGDRLSAGVQYRFGFLRFTEPLTLLSYQNDLRLLIFWRF